MNFDFIVVGGGIAGLNGAIRLSDLGSVLVVTKEKLADCNTQLAQGGIAASMGQDDNPELHFRDTLAAGAGLCEEAAVRMMVDEGPRRIKQLMAMGMHFDQENGRLAMAREGAHCRSRVLRAGGDSTGRLIWQALAARAKSIARITIWEHVPVQDLLVEEGICQGISVLAGGSVQYVRGRAVLLASGGAGQLYPVTTNPPTATGDGIAMAYRAGADIRDLEFIQFHPTALAVPASSGFLVSEAVRGEGGILRNQAGEAFMARYHPMADLGPRDVVSRAICQEMKREGQRSVYLDVTHFPAGFFAARFPQIHAHLSQLGIDPEKKLIPIAPAAHYMMGGVKTGLWGETNIAGLFAAGEVANTGVHGANRLASNSLLEGLVFSSRAVEGMADRLGAPLRKLRPHLCRRQPVSEYGPAAREMMAASVGMVRDRADLVRAVEYFQSYAGELTVGVTDCEQLISCNMGLVAYLVSFAALCREESRGGHFRLDYPAENDLWRQHLVIRKDEGGDMLCQLKPMHSAIR